MRELSKAFEGKTDKPLIRLVQTRGVLRPPWGRVRRSASEGETGVQWSWWISMSGGNRTGEEQPKKSKETAIEPGEKGGPKREKRWVGVGSTRRHRGGARARGPCRGPRGNFPWSIRGAGAILRAAKMNIARWNSGDPRQRHPGIGRRVPSPCFSSIRPRLAGCRGEAARQAIGSKDVQLAASAALHDAFRSGTW